MATHGHSDRRSVVVLEMKGWRKQQKMQMVNRQLRHTKPNYIPNDIVVEILSRLPAKSLLQLRWSCKYWFDLITRDHDFIKMHQLRSTTTHDELFSIISPSVLSTRSSYKNNEIFQCYINYSYKTKYEMGLVPNEVSIVFPNWHPLESFYEILGSCNGLMLLLLKLPRKELCIWNPLLKLPRKELCIWNPCTREYTILPHPPYLVWPNNYGFGYDQTTDDYKVIRISICWEVQVYTLRTNTWRWIERNLYTLSIPSTMNIGRDIGRGVFVNGTLYWKNCLHRNIISFDIGKEKFQHVSKLPNVIDHDENWHNVKLQVFEGSLCMVLKIKEEQNYRAEMWVLKDYNHSKSVWTKIITIPNQCGFLLPTKPLRYIRNGELLMLNDHKELILYDLKKNTIKTLCTISRYHIEEVYSESLVCLNSGMYTTEKTRKEQTKNKNKELIFSLISNQNKIVFREYMRRGLSNKNKNKIVFNEKLWQGRHY